MKKVKVVISLFVLFCMFECSDSLGVHTDLYNSLPFYDILAINYLDDIGHYTFDVYTDGYLETGDIAYPDSNSDIEDMCCEVEDAQIVLDASTTDVGEVVCPQDMVNAARYAGDLTLGETETSYLKGDCDAVVYSIVIPSGSEFSFFVRGDYLKPMVIMNGPGRKRIDKKFEQIQRGLPLIFTFRADRSGEYFLTLSQIDYKKGSPYSITVSCIDNCSSLATRYPIVLVHGFSGFKNIGPVEYFYKVPDVLAKLGYDVHIAKLDPYNSIEVRGAQLARFIDEVLSETFSYKVNIIAHSQGGLDSRYVISALMKAEEIAALITVATPHYGTPLADFILSDPTGVGKSALDAFLVIIGAALDSQSRANAMASLNSLSVGYITGEFNKKYPDDPRVKYFSYAGKTCRAWEGCGDTVDVELSLTYEILHSIAGDNDGIVPTASGVWGNFLGILPADHFDEVGQVAGVTNENFNHIEFYKGLAAILMKEGF